MARSLYFVERRSEVYGLYAKAGTAANNLVDARRRVLLGVEEKALVEARCGAVRE
jgi:hypothetical protein